MVRAITLNSFIAYFVFNTFTNIMQYKEDKKKKKHVVHVQIISCKGKKHEVCSIISFDLCIIIVTPAWFT